MRPLLSLLVVLATPRLSPAQEPGSPPFTTTGAFLALSVADLEASVRWYSDKLGLTVTQRPPEYEQSQAVILEGRGLVVELLKQDDAVAPSAAAPHLVHGFFKAGFIVDDFESAMTMLRSRGVEIAMGPFPARPGQRANVIVRDNSGNLIQILAKAP